MAARPKNVLITDDVHPLLIEGCLSRGYQVDYLPAISLEDTLGCIQAYSALVINSKIKVDRAMMDRGVGLQWIGRLGSGLEIIDLDYACQRGIHLISTPEANCQAVAEHALGMLLSLFRKLAQANREIRVNQWFREKNRGIELHGKTVGIIGFGHTGPAFAKLLEGFNVKILVFDKYKQHLKLPDRYEQVKNLEEIQKKAEIISLHIPLSAETKHLVNKEFIDGCAFPFYLINTSRGAVVRTTDLMDALRSGQVLGACLDVFENEHPGTYSCEERTMYSTLFDFEQLVLSPHIAGWTHQSKEKIAKVLLEKHDAWLASIMS